ncbi:SDR family NAD(P)-dependent oxidoreductase [Ottowia caeni]|uniref:SDR family NAD(P)-dependent oxidoreductase n=1 Tax=Ottowia caeni TaxID=2870339 RepID=UPI001E4D6699
MKRIVIIGATSALAEHCARLWLLKQPADLTLVGRDAQRVERVAADLQVRSPQSRIRIIQAEFLDPDSIGLTARRISQAGPIDIVLIAHGSLPNQTECQDDLPACRDALSINGLSPVLFAEAFAKELEQFKHGTLALIGSVAGDRGRKSNYVYGAAKGLLARYAEGLQHRFAGTGVKIVLVKPGPMETPMTAHMKGAGVKLASVEGVAKQVIKAIETGKPLLYTPEKWMLIMRIIQHLPRAIFNKLEI